MGADRRTRLWDAVVAHADGAPVAMEDVCATAMEAAGVDAATVVVVLPDDRRETVWVSGPIASQIEEITETIGEGPGVDACQHGPVLAADLATAESRGRWPMFAPAAEAAGIRAAFGLPLQVGSIRLGVIDLYRAVPGGLDRDQLADTLILADAACALLLDAASAAGERRPGGWFDHAGPHHPEVHQATGMMTVQLGVTAAVAFIRLRAYAFAQDRRMRDVAADVVARRLRFAADSEDGGSG
jgi:hypothetical protein